MGDLRQREKIMESASSPNETRWQTSTMVDNARSLSVGTHDSSPADRDIARTKYRGGPWGLMMRAGRWHSPPSASPDVI